MSQSDSQKELPRMDSHETRIELFNGNKIGQVFIACALAVNGLAIYAIALSSLFLAIFWWRYPQNFYALVFNAVNTVSGALTFLVWLGLISAFGLVGGLILNKAIWPFIRNMKELFWPGPKVHAVTETMMIYSGNLSVHDHVQDKTIYHYKIDTAKAAEPPLVAFRPALPGKCYLTDVLRDFDLSLDSIFLGLGKGGHQIACSLEGFLHVAHDGPTGRGKSVLSYAELVMLLKLGVRVILCNPHFVPVDKKGRDWRPIGQAIEAQGMVELAPGIQVPGLIRRCTNIEQILKWLSTREIPRRFDLQLRGDYHYQPIYLFIDEWPVIVSECPEAGTSLADILRRGRAVEVCVSANAQGFLTEDVNLKGSARENFNTAYHLGGSVHSGAKLLDMPVKDINALLREEQVTLGEGIALLRNNEACPQAQLVRIPYPTNEVAYYLLGRADDWQLSELRARTTGRYTETMPGTGFAASPVSQTQEHCFRAATEPLPPVSAVSREAAKAPKYIPTETEKQEILRLFEEEGLSRRQIRERLKW